MPEIENTRNEPETPREPRETTLPNEGERPNVLKEFSRKVDTANFANDLKRLVQAWILQQVDGVTREALSDKIEEKKAKEGNMEFSWLLDGAAEAYAEKHPEDFRALEKGELTKGQYGQKVLDAVFQFALDANSAPENLEQRTQIEAMQKEVNAWYAEAGK